MNKKDFVKINAFFGPFKRKQDGSTRTQLTWPSLSRARYEFFNTCSSSFFNSSILMSLPNSVIMDRDPWSRDNRKMLYHRVRSAVIVIHFVFLWHAARSQRHLTEEFQRHGKGFVCTDRKVVKGDPSGDQIYFFPEIPRPPKCSNWNRNPIAVTAAPGTLEEMEIEKRK